ncbi:MULTISPECIES: antitoxin VbhA family protein [Nocardiopsis]|uniref:Antitoxin VbhA domain-containing protein n=1 Tax=Nocardiopsis sinuspersici TaxID=501010 RepID=A0A1V3BVB1_9ACTN|nr:MULTISPECIES: antitoxin VbhA family protein [Nocardiopsis]OOC52491.1 hypothetical protein NOSIN_00450 [Nocardiopsis sinuspersici]
MALTTTAAIGLTGAQRRERVEETIHSGEMEGFTVTAAFRRDADAYVAGAIDVDDLVERTRRRYGLT